MTDRMHFILSNRKVYNAFGKRYLHIDSEIEPDLPLHYTFCEIPLMANTRSRVTAPVIPVTGDFTEHILREAAGHENVTLFIHGFHHLFDLSFKVDIFNMMVKQYCEKEKAVGKFIFFSWPSTQSRHYLDDRAHEQGVMLQRNSARIFKRLHEELNATGKQFNLMVHSMGHRLLNGFLSEVDTRNKLFDKVFLFAPDVPHKSFDVTLPGVVIRNRKNSVRDGESLADDVQRLFNLTPLSSVAGEVHCYHYKYDRILIAGVAGELKRYEEFNNNLVDDCLCLGNLGGERINSHSTIFFHDVSELLLRDNFFSAFLVKNKDKLDEMKGIIESNEIHDNAKWFAALKSIREPWVKLHRYFVECDGVARHVSERIGSGSLNV